MKILSILIMALMLGGCFYQVVSSKDIELANLYCQDKGGLQIIQEYFDGTTRYRCNNDSPMAEPTNENDAAKSLLLKDSAKGANSKRSNLDEYTPAGKPSCSWEPIRQAGEASYIWHKRALAWHNRCIEDK